MEHAESMERKIDLMFNLNAGSAAAANCARQVIEELYQRLLAVEKWSGLREDARSERAMRNVTIAGSDITLSTEHNEAILRVPGPAIDAIDQMSAGMFHFELIFDPAVADAGPDAGPDADLNERAGR
jgi:hypothetical protein